MPATNNVQFLALVSGTASLMWTSGSGKNDPTDIGNVPSNTINAGNTYFNTAQMICSQGGYIGWINSNQCMISGASLGGQQNSVVLIGSVLTAQTITFPAPVVSANASMPVFLQATATSGLPVSYTILGPATLNRGMVTFTGYGTVTVTATQAGNSAYGPAPPVQVSFSAPPAGYAWIPAPVPPPNAVTAPDAPNKAVCRGMDSAQRSWVGYWDGAKCVGSYGGMTMPAPTFVMFLQVMGSVQMQPVWVSGTAKVQPGNIGTVPSNTINGGNTYTNMPQVICSMGGYVGWVYSNQCSIGGASLNMQQNATVLIGVVP
jgi:hypothetical protein